MSSTVADRSKALRDLESIERSLAAMGGLLTPAKMSLQERLEGLVAYEAWLKRSALEFPWEPARG